MRLVSNSYKESSCTFSYYNNPGFKLWAREFVLKKCPSNKTYNSMDELKFIDEDRLGPLKLTVQNIITFLGNYCKVYQRQKVYEWINKSRLINALYPYPFELTMENVEMFSGNYNYRITQLKNTCNCINESQPFDALYPHPLTFENLSDLETI